MDSGVGGTPPTFPTGGGGGGGSTLGNIGTIANIGTGIAGTIAGLMESAKRGKLTKKQLKQIKKLQGIIVPFASQLVSYGIDPVQFLKSPQGQAMLRPVLEASSREFEGARQSLIDSGAGSGFSPGSGMVAGPFANLLSDQAKTASDIRSGQIGQALNFGTQGANILAGQQGATVPAIQQLLNAPNIGLQLAGASGIGMNTLLQWMALLGNKKSAPSGPPDWGTWG